MADPDIRQDTLFDLLSNEHRRRLLPALVEHNPQPEMPSPAAVAVDGNKWEPIRQELYHLHLPKLEAAGVIRWDRGSQRVLKGPAFRRVRPLLKPLDGRTGALPEEPNVCIASGHPDPFSGR